MIFGLGAPELIFILVIVLVIFGPKNLPKLGQSLGKTVKGIREGMDEIEDSSKSTEAEDVIVDHEPVDSDNDAPASDGTFCPNCGAKNPAENHFCSKCGSKLGE